MLNEAQAFSRLKDLVYHFTEGDPDKLDAFKKYLDDEKYWPQDTVGRARDAFGAYVRKCAEERWGRAVVQGTYFESILPELRTFVYAKLAKGDEARCMTCIERSKTTGTMQEFLNTVGNKSKIILVYVDQYDKCYVICGDIFDIYEGLKANPVILRDCEIGLDEFADTIKELRGGTDDDSEA